MTCRHCGREIVFEDGIWVDPNATGDDSIWRETCERHETFTAEHEPDLAPADFDQWTAELEQEPGVFSDLCAMDALDWMGSESFTDWWARQTDA